MNKNNNHWSGQKQFTYGRIIEYENHEGIIYVYCTSDMTSPAELIIPRGSIIRQDFQTDHLLIDEDF